MMTLGDALEVITPSMRTIVEDKDGRRIAEQYAANLRETHLRSILIAPVKELAIRVTRERMSDGEKLEQINSMDFESRFADLKEKIYMVIRLDSTYIGATGGTEE